MPPATGSDSGSGTGADTPPTVSVTTRAIMPRPGQPGALVFDGNNVSEFIKNWNFECHDYGYTDSDKCSRLPYYCTRSIKDVVELFPGYIASDWTAFEKELRQFYWDRDVEKNTTAALNQLIQESSALDVNTYILKYTSITAHLFDSHEISNLQRCRKLLDGLSQHLKAKTIEHCAAQGWKLSSKESESAYLCRISQVCSRESQCGKEKKRI